MHDFEHALAAYVAGHLSEAELLTSAGRLASAGSTEIARARQAIEVAYGQGTLSTQCRASLQAELDEVTLLAPRAASATPSHLPIGGTYADDETRTLANSNLEPTLAPKPPLELTTDTPSGGTSSLRDPNSLKSTGQENIQVGSVLKERFVLKQVLGVGGMGTVFKALDMRKVEAEDKDPYVAIKLLNAEFRDNPMALVGLQRETKRAQTLSHPNIINVYDFDRDGQHVYMSMEYLTGRPLTAAIREIPEGGLKFKQIWPIIESIAKALGHAHRKGIVHSDLKPGNVFIDEDGEVKVLDFGIAGASKHRDRPEDATVFDARQLGAFTPAYASFEQLRGEDPDPRDDIYALACVTYELLTGKHPFGKLPADKALELKLQPQPIPKLGRKPWKGLQRALALRKQDRTPSTDAFVADLSPGAPWFLGLTAALVIVGSLTAANVYLGMRQPSGPAKPPLTVELDAAQKQKIADLLELAATHFDVGFYTAPTGSNALWAYREVLKIDPYNESAVAGIRKITDTLEQEAWEAFEKGDRKASMKKVMEGLEVNPTHEGLLQLKAKLRG